MKTKEPFGWYDPTNHHFSTNRNDSGFTMLGQIWPLYTSYGYATKADDVVFEDLKYSIELNMESNRDEGGEYLGVDKELLEAMITTLEYYTPLNEMHIVDEYRERLKTL